MGCSSACTHTCIHIPQSPDGCPNRTPIYTCAGIHHRFFSHQAYACSRLTTFCLGLYSTLVAQRGPLWWSSKHIRHHKARNIICLCVWVQARQTAPDSRLTYYLNPTNSTARTPASTRTTTRTPSTASRTGSTATWSVCVVYTPGPLLAYNTPSDRASLLPHTSPDAQGWTVHPYERRVDWDFVHPQYKVRMCGDRLTERPHLPCTHGWPKHSFCSYITNRPGRCCSWRP